MLSVSCTLWSVIRIPMFLIFQFPDNVLDIFHGNRVYSGKRFVKHDKFRVDGQTAGNFRTAAFTSGELVS